MAASAEVEVGIIDIPAARARRGSLCGASISTWSLVVQCTVVMEARSIPKASWTTVSTTAMPFVVQEALDTIR